MRNLTTLMLFSAISLFMLLAGGGLTALGMGSWYENLSIPPWQPPGWVFTPVWITVLGLLAVATWLMLPPAPPLPKFALSLYGIQVVLNIAWSGLFFALHSPGLALIDILVLDLVLAGMIAAYLQLSRTAALLLVPYLVWLLFATAINFWIVQNNPTIFG